MTELDYAIERLTAWVRDYGPDKSATFIQDLNTVLEGAATVRHINKLIKIAEIAAIIVDRQLVPGVEGLALKRAFATFKEES